MTDNQPIPLPAPATLAGDADWLHHSSSRSMRRLWWGAALLVIIGRATRL